MRARNQTWRSSGSEGFTLVELLVVVAVVGVMAAIATPGLLRSRMSGNEASAIASLRAVISAQQDFGAISRGYADSLETLSGMCPGATAPFISPDLGSNGAAKSGYVFTVAAGLDGDVSVNDCFGNPTQTSYYASAAPLTVGATGTRGFATNVGAVVWQDSSGAVPTEPFAVAGTVGPIGR